jgi:PiT family inorganic phosphate transporter
LPASSSHSLIGSIIGIGLAFNFIPGTEGTAVNWGKAQEIGISLLLSPLFGFAFAICIMYVFKRLIKNEYIYKEPIPGKVPPNWIRGILITTCSLVSLGHGSNDGQKGVGLMMLILIGILPAEFALKSDYDILKTYNDAVYIKSLVINSDASKLNASEHKLLDGIISNCDSLISITKGKSEMSEISKPERFLVRKNVLLISNFSKKLLDKGNFPVSKNDTEKLIKATKSLRDITDYAPRWVIVMISISLGLGTMIGWKRIVKTVGEKIGKQHMSYAQGASAELVAAVTVGLSSFKGLPVSTTHVLSSGIAGTMVAKKGLKNLQKSTIRNILLAWVLTLPVTMLLSGGLFLLFRFLF